MDEQGSWRMRGVRGATTVSENHPDAIREATRELLAEMVKRNDIHADDVASAYFTTTPDLDAEFPAVVARRDFEWTNVALMCGHEMDVPGSLRHCLRILLHVNSQRRQDEIDFVYLRGARALRPDLGGQDAPPK
ncbi:MAG TPA: chorismate mutase [Dehalococcoidia bacterium]|nr:chorismate mutase [Dehalococcoidia bacterium]